jgi:hypothetical protein
MTLRYNLNYNIESLVHKSTLLKSSLYFCYQVPYNDVPFFHFGFFKCFFYLSFEFFQNIFMHVDHNFLKINS